MVSCYLMGVSFSFAELKSGGKKMYTEHLVLPDTQ